MESRTSVGHQKRRRGAALTHLCALLLLLMGLEFPDFQAGEVANFKFLEILTNVLKRAFQKSAWRE